VSRPRGRRTADPQSARAAVEAGRTAALGGWRFFFDVLLPAAAANSRVAAEGLRQTEIVRNAWLHAAAPAASTQSKRKSPRARSRRSLALVAACLRRLVHVGISWLSAGGCSDGLGVGENATLMAGRHSAPEVESLCRKLSRESPLQFVGDKRGQMKALFMDLLSDRPTYETQHVEWAYAAPVGGPSVPFIASRLGLPPRAAFVNLSAHLDPELRDAFICPDLEEPPGELPPRGFFRVGMLEWRAAVRRMLRCGLGALLGRNVSAPRLAAGAFAVRKSVDEDRLIGDRRPMNFMERQLRSPALPYAPRLRRLCLRPGECLVIHTKDLRHAFYVYGVAAERLSRQVIGPHIPLAWFENLDSEEFDYVEDATAWWHDDMRVGTRAPRAAPVGFTQFALGGVIMGDLNAVTAVQTAHRALLLSCGALQPTGLLLPGMPLPRSEVFGDVYIDDLTLMAIAPFVKRGRPEHSGPTLYSSLPAPSIAELRRRSCLADSAYEQVGIEQSAKKAQVEQEVTEVWGAELRQSEGTVGFPRARRASLCVVALLAVAVGASGRQLQQLLGALSFQASFRREMLAIFDVAFVAARRLPPRRPCRLEGALADELACGSFLSVLAETSLRAQPLLRVFATDASPARAGAAVCSVDEETWRELFSLAEAKGEHVRLDWGRTPPPTSLIDRRAAAAAFCVRQHWGVYFGYKFRRSRHINILEMEALASLLRRLKGEKTRGRRNLVFLDSRVCVGAVAKGRSSSRALNAVLRRMASMLLEQGNLLEVVWVATWANPGDPPSRGTSLSKWMANLPQLPFMNDLLAARFVNEGTEEGLRHLRWLENAVGEILLATLAEQKSALPETRGEPAPAEVVGDEAPRALRRMAVRDPGVRALWRAVLRSRSNERGGRMLEVFAGSGHLTTAVRRAHPGACLPGVDLLCGPLKIDLTDVNAVEELLQLLSVGAIPYVHFGTPCSSFSSALRGPARLRSGASPAGDESYVKCRTGNALARFTSAAAGVLDRASCAWSVENPLTSLIWRFFQAEAPLPPHCRTRIDQCRYGLTIPGEGLARKATIVASNFRPLSGLEVRCGGGHPHVPLKGSFFDFKVKRCWRARTEFAGAYPPALCRAWAAVLEPIMAARRKDLADVVRHLLICAGDVEVNPGPNVRRNPAQEGDDLFTSDVMQTTATAYSRALERFEAFLRVRGICYSAAELVARGDYIKHILWYLRSAYAAQELGPSSVGTLVSASVRLLNLSRTLGVRISLRDRDVGPLWKALRTWRTNWPHEFRKPVHVEVALAISVFFWTCGPMELALWALVTFHCMLRPTEGLSIHGEDFYEVPLEQRWRYRAVAGIVGLRRPKTARLPVHAARQYVTVEDCALASLLSSARSNGLLRAGRPLWAGSERSLAFHWGRACTALGLASLGLTPAGLRPGGATDYFLRVQDVPALRRRGRWSNEKTLERYLHEGLYFLLTSTNELQKDRNGLDPPWPKVMALARLAPAIFAPSAREE
jgi:hypothetical protein